MRDIDSLALPCHFSAMRPLFLFAAALVSIAAAPPAPKALQPYIHDGRFDPGDYNWMRGRFADASEADRAITGEIDEWVRNCQAAGLAETRSELQAMGIADPKLENPPMRHVLCGQVASAFHSADKISFAEFQRALAVAKPIADTYLLAVTRATEAAAEGDSKVEIALVTRPIGEQMLRWTFGWGQGEMTGAPKLDPLALSIFLSRMTAAVTEVDHANTEWLKAVVAKQGWPRISQVGAPAAHQAWLLVQHADADPPFQLRALRLMEALLPSGEASKRNYAYLYDRVMMKMAGHQRYATQMTCSNGERVPLPLEDPATVDQSRAQADLEPLAAYHAQMNKLFGPCPPDQKPG